MNIITYWSTKDGMKLCEIAAKNGLKPFELIKKIVRKELGFGDKNEMPRQSEA